MTEPQQYRVLRGLNYPPLKRAEPGDVIADLPAESVEHELRAGTIEEIKPTKGKK